MFGTVAHLKLKPGHEQAMMDLQKDWDEQRRPAVEGAISTYVFKSERDPEEYTLVAIFRDRESYFANAADPKQDEWYQKMRSHLQADPEWIDGSIVSSMVYSK